ncbi:hypothetical protein HMPREF9065_00917 [Aggregatibacter sp. oral taxon 458 str. W10330]|nr:hypothetical protein HMPREF9065_00917 [Aggregatibacter sp. oral taxon 458 str. W10330]
MEIDISGRTDFVSIVGLNTKLVEEYIRNRGKEDRFKIIYRRKSMIPLKGS